MKKFSEKRRSGFQYKRRDPAAVKRQASQSGGMYDNPFKNDFPVFTIKPGKNYRIRFLPPTWEDAEHYGYPIFIHSQIGADKGNYPCLKKHGDGEGCPICDASAEAAKARGDERKSDGSDLDYQLKAKQRYGYWIIDRDNEDEGPKIWSPSWMTDRDIAALAIDERTQEVLWLDDPDKGYDVEFKVEKDGKWNKLVGIKVARKSTPLSDDPDQAQEWLDYVNKHPIPDCLKIYDAEYLEKVLSGLVSKDDEDEDEDEDGDRRRRRDHRSTKSSSRRRDEEEDEEEDEDDDEEEDRPRRRKRLDLDEDVEEDEDDGEDDEELEDDDDEGDSDSDEDDDDEDQGEDDDDEREERKGGKRHGRKKLQKRLSKADHSERRERRQRDDDEASPRRQKAKGLSRRSRDDDDDDDDEGDDD